MTKENSLPDGWVWTTIGDIVTFEYGKGLVKAKRDESGKVPVYGSNGIVGYHTKPLVEKPCLIIGRKGAAGMVHISNEPCWPIDTTYYVIPPDNISLSFLYYLFSSLALDSLDRSTAIPGLNRNDAYTVKIPLPPPSEQQRIVAKIEELFTQLEAGTTALRRVQAGLKRYKASVLKAAVEGNLTARERKFGEDGLPTGWRWAKLSEIAEVRLGRQRSPSRASGPNMKQYLRAANITWNGIDLTDVKEMDFSPKEQEIYRLKHGDILLSEASGSISEVGKPAIWKNQLEEAYFQNTLIRVRLIEDIPEYLYYHFLYDAIAERFRKIAKGVGIHHLGAGNLSNWIVSIPPVAEQQRIVAEVERRLSVVAQAEAAVNAGLARADRLRQAILKQAFAGKLAPQDPPAEPAGPLPQRSREAGEDKAYLPYRQARLFP